jgi:pimeloyl-ACP methyl ester carboxylesterase
MRIVLFLGLLMAFVFAGYVTITGYFLAKGSVGLLRVGTIAAMLLQEETPEDPTALGYRGNPMQALSLPFQIVPIETPLGPTEAWMVPAQGAEAGRAIYVHGIAGAREDGYRHLTTLHQAGYSVLMIGYRNDPGAPETADGLYGFGLTEWPDLEAAVATFSPGPDGPGLLIVAESMGAAILGQFLARSDLADRVAAIALDSPALSFAEVLQHLAEQDGYPLPGAMAWAAGLILPQLTDLPLTEAEVAPVFAAFPGPLFIAHGSGDRIVPLTTSEELAAARPSDSTQVLWTEADHLGSYAADPAAYSAALSGFLSGLAP